MIEEIVNAAVEPLRHPIGWQGFAYGVLGKVIVLYAREFISTISPKAEEAINAGDEQVEEDTQNESE